MENKYKNLIPILILILIGLGMGIGMGRGCNPKKEVQYFQQPGFKTDTTIAPQTQLVKEEAKQEKKGEGKYFPMPAKEVKIYIHDTTWVDTGSTIMVNRYTNKFRGAYLTGDDFKLQVIDTNGDIIESDYPVNYSLYDYHHDGFTMSYKVKESPLLKTPSGKPKRNLSTTSNAYIGYEPFKKAPTVMIDYSLNYKRVGLFVMGQTQYSIKFDESNLNLVGGLRINLR